MGKEKAQDVDVWTLREVKRWRTGASIVWSALLAIPVTLAFILAADVDILHPIGWITSNVLKLISFSEWTTFVFIMFITIAVGWFDSKHYNFKPQILSCRLDVVWNFLKPQRILQLGFHITLAVLLIRNFLSMTNDRFRSLTIKCPPNVDSEDYGSDIYCLNEFHLFVTMFGVIVGGMYTVKVFLHQHNYIQFPIVQQCKFFQVKSGFIPLLLSTMSAVFHILKYYYLLYYLFLGSASQRSLRRNVGLLESPNPQVNTIRGMLDVGLFWTTLLAGTFAHFMFSLPALLYKVYHTEPIQYPIETQRADMKNKCLYNALSCNVSYVQYHGFLDFYLLSKHSPPRRKELFSLTQLGGHPQNWNSVASECLNHLKAFTVELAHFNAKTIVDGPIRQLSGDKGGDATKTKAFGQQADNLTFRGHQLTNPPADTPSNPPAQNKMLQKLKNRKALVFLLSELPDKESQKLFAESQKYIWAVQGLSNLVIGSFKEDKYGVVQKSLPDIISTLLSLQEVVEKHFKLGASINRKPIRGSANCDGNDLRFALKSVLKSSIYEIVITFGDHIQSIPVEPEEKKKLQLFVDFKE